MIDEMIDSVFCIWIKPEANADGCKIGSSKVNFVYLAFISSRKGSVLYEFCERERKLTFILIKCARIEAHRHRTIPK